MTLGCDQCGRPRRSSLYDRSMSTRKHSVRFAVMSRTSRVVCPDQRCAIVASKCRGEFCLGGSCGTNSINHWIGMPIFLSVCPSIFGFSDDSSNTLWPINFYHNMVVKHDRSLFPLKMGIVLANMATSTAILEMCLPDDSIVHVQLNHFGVDTTCLCV